jgi:hypothetical protein
MIQRLRSLQEESGPMTSTGMDDPPDGDDLRMGSAYNSAVAQGRGAAATVNIYQGAPVADYVLEDIAARAAGYALLQLERLPQGFHGYYEQFWAVIEPQGKRSAI